MFTNSVSPALITGFFAVTGATAFLLGAPEPLTAAIILLFAALVSSMNPANAIIFLLLSTPFLLGESGWPYYWMTEALVFIALVSALVHYLRRGSSFETPFLHILTLLAITSVCSLPIDLKEFYYDLWVSDSSEMFFRWLSAHPAPKLHYVRILTNLLSGIGLFYITYNYARKAGWDSVLGVLKAAVIVCGCICIIAIALGSGLIPKQGGAWRYLTISLVGSYNGGITGFAYALHFFNQYLLLLTPISIYAIFIARKKPLELLVFTAIFLLISYCLIQGGLRSSAALYLMTVLLSVVLLLRFVVSGAGYNKLYVMAGLAVTLCPAVYFLITGRAMERFTTEILSNLTGETMTGAFEFIDDPLYFLKHGVSEPRFFLWHTAILMFISSPFLGVGLGRYTHLFREYFTGDFYNWADIGFASGASAHSFYLEILADQGIIGFGIWMLFLSVVIFTFLRTIKNESQPDKKALAMALAFSIILWLMYGVTHHMPLCRAIEIYFWITLGLLTGLSGDLAMKRDLKKTTTISIALVILMAFFYQINLVMSRPIPDNFSTGFFSWEKKPDGNYYRWMGKRGVFKASPKYGGVKIPMVITLNGLEANPRKVTVWSGAGKQEVVIADRDLHTIEVPAPSRNGEDMMIWMEIDQTFDPVTNRISGHTHPLGIMVQKTD